MRRRLQREADGMTGHPWSVQITIPKRASSEHGRIALAMRGKRDRGVNGRGVEWKGERDEERCR